MTKPIAPKVHSGSKYLRTFHDITSDTTVLGDVYTVLEAFAVTCPARQHAIKKLLCAGRRGKADTLKDLCETQDAITRAIELETKRTEK